MDAILMLLDSAIGMLNLLRTLVSLLSMLSGVGSNLIGTLMSLIVGLGGGAF